MDRISKALSYGRSSNATEKKQLPLITPQSTSAAAGNFDDYFRSNHVVLVATYQAEHATLTRTKLDGILFVEKNSSNVHFYPTNDGGVFENEVFDSNTQTKYATYPEPKPTSEKKKNDE